MWRYVAILGALFGLVIGLPVGSNALGAGDVGTHRLPLASARPAFVAGYTTAGLTRGSSVTIYANGRTAVRGSLSADRLQKVTLSRSSLRALLKQAEADEFFAMPPVLPAMRTPDIPETYIQIHTRSSSKAVYEIATEHPSAYNVDFDRLYFLIFSAAGVSTKTFAFDPTPVVPALRTAD